MHPDLIYEHDAALAEADALRALAPSAYEAGYQAGFADALERAGGLDLRDRIGAVLAAHGCDCLCDHHPDERRPDCHVCLACRIEAAMRNDA